MRSIDPDNSKGQSESFDFAADHLLIFFAGKKKLDIFLAKHHHLAAFGKIALVDKTSTLHLIAGTAELRRIDARETRRNVIFGSGYDTSAVNHARHIGNLCIVRIPDSINVARLQIYLAALTVAVPRLCRLPAPHLQHI